VGSELTNPGPGRDTTVLASEPMPGDGQVPHMPELVDRLYHRFPQIYRTMDGRAKQWPLKRWLGAVLDYAGTIDADVLAWNGFRPIGPADPEPWGLPVDELARWRAERRSVLSTLADPLTARAQWLPWLAQLVGAVLDPAASEAEKRDTIRYATSGWRAGTRGAISDAAKSALTGGKYARVVPHWIPSGLGGISPGTIWDTTIVTRVSETPDPEAVLGAILRSGVKPAGVRLHHAVYEATWDQIQAVYPTWEDWEALTWDQQAEAGLIYRTVTGNVIPNPSLEVNTTGWAARGAISTFGRVVGGVDGAGMGRVTTTAAGTGEVSLPSTPVTPGTYAFSFSIRPDEARSMSYTVDFLTAGATSAGPSQTVVVGALTADSWRRPDVATITVPATAVTARAYVQVTGMALGEHYDIDAAFMRRLT
jgi:hypothetical protein